jgi:hypothetical protein
MTPRGMRFLTLKVFSAACLLGGATPSAAMVTPGQGIGVSSRNDASSAAQGRYDPLTVHVIALVLAYSRFSCFVCRVPFLSVSEGRSRWVSYERRLGTALPFCSLHHAKRRDHLPRRKGMFLGWEGEGITRSVMVRDPQRFPPDIPRQRYTHAAISSWLPSRALTPPRAAGESQLRQYPGEEFLLSFCHLIRYTYAHTACPIPTLFAAHRSGRGRVGDDL